MTDSNDDQRPSGRHVSRNAVSAPLSLFLLSPYKLSCSRTNSVQGRIAKVPGHSLAPPQTVV